MGASRISTPVAGLHLRLLKDEIKEAWFPMVIPLRELPKYRELLKSITIREIKVRYKQSLLGMAWAVLQPLSMMAIFTIIFSRFAKIPSDGIPYPIFSYSALLPWSFFSASLSFAIPSVVNNADLIKKIYFPREIFPCASILAAGVDFCIATTIFVIMLIFYKISITWNILYVIPLMLIQIVFALSLSLFVAAVNVRYRDVKYALPLILQIWMYATPIIYPVSIVPERLRTVYMLNPMASLIDGYRRAFLLGLSPDFHYIGLTFVVTMAVFFASYRYFKKEEMTFADII